MRRLSLLLAAQTVLAVLAVLAVLGWSCAGNPKMFDRDAVSTQLSPSCGAVLARSELSGSLSFFSPKRRAPAERCARGAEERLSPILMTASCAGLALLPLVVSGNLPGHEIEHPMAVVILGGLATSTLLNLFFLPALYARFGSRR